MFNSFSEFKGKSGTFEALQETIATMAKSGFKKEVDPTRWKATSDKAGNGSAVIRFLPAPKGEDLPVVKLMSHGFQGPSGKWLIENCPTTINQPCPVCIDNSRLWALNDKKDSPERKLASSRKRKVQFISNILVVKDPKNPDSEGKVFRFDYGTKIMEKILGSQNPSDDMKELGAVSIPILFPSGLWEGANFTLSFKVVNKQRNYDASTFGPVCPVADNDEAIEAVWLAEHSLAELVAPDKFKSFEELEKKFNFVLNAPPSAIKEPVEEEILDEEETPEPEIKTKKAKAHPKAASKLEKEETSEDAKDPVEDIAFFQSLAKKKVVEVG